MDDEEEAVDEAAFQQLAVERGGLSMEGHRAGTFRV